MKTGRRIFKNMLSLSVAEIANKGIALVTMAYLARVIQPEGFGIIGWANALVVYFVFLVDLGFNVIGPREIAKFPEKIKDLVNSITSIKISFSLILYLILAVLVFFMNKPIEVKIVVLISGLNIFANSILFNWVFQGIEKMEIIAIRQVTTSLLNLFGIFILVHSPADVIIAMSVTIGSMLINSIWMLFYYIKLYGGIKFKYDFSLWKELLASSLPVALTMFITILYNNLSMFLLGLMRSDYEVGIYSAAFRVLAFALVPTGILQNAFIPQLARSSSIQEKHKFTEKYVLFTFIFGAIITAGFFTFSDYIVNVGFGYKFADSSLILKLLMVTGILAFMNVSYSAPLLSWKYERKIFWAMGVGGIVNISLNIILIPYYGAVGAAIAAISTEFAVFIGLSIIMYSAIQKLYLISLLKVLLYALLSCFAGYQLMNIGIHAIIAGSVSIVLFGLINFVFKTVTIEEVKMYLKKN